MRRVDELAPERVLVDIELYADVESPQVANSSTYRELHSMARDLEAQIEATEELAGAVEGYFALLTRTRYRVEEEEQRDVIRAALARFNELRNNEEENK